MCSRGSHFTRVNVSLCSISIHIIPSNNEEEVREEWERIQIAYNILIDSKMRKRYDRSEMIADPGAAMRRAAVGATLNGVSDLGKGLFSLGQKAVESLAAVAATATSKQADDGSAKKSR